MKEVGAKKDEDDESDFTPGAVELAKMPLRIEHLLTSPNGSALAIVTNAINQRQEKYEDVEIYTIDLTGHAHEPLRITTNQAIEVRPRWASDSRHIFFSVEVGDPFGPYRDLQPHLYWVDTADKKVEQWAKDFTGQIVSYNPYSNGVVVAARLRH